MRPSNALIMVMVAFLPACQMVNVNTGAGTLSSMPATTVSPPVTVPVQVGPGGLPSLPGGLGSVFMLPMPSQPIVVQPPDPIVVKPGLPVPTLPSSVSPGEMPAGIPPAALRARHISPPPALNQSRFVMWKDM